MCVCVFVYNNKLFHNHTSFLHKCRWQFFRNFLFAFYFQLKYSDNGQLRDIHWIDGWMVWHGFVAAASTATDVEWIGYAKCLCHSFYGHTVIAIINTGFHTKNLHLWFIWRSLFYLRQLVSSNINRIFAALLFFLYCFMGELSGFVTLAPNRTVLWCWLISWFIKSDALLDSLKYLHTKSVRILFYGWLVRQHLWIMEPSKTSVICTMILRNF